MEHERNDIDLLIGMVLRQIRLSHGDTLQSLAERTGITYQQIQKYETGANRLSVSRLFLLTRSLGVTAADFLQRVQDQMEQEKRLSLEPSHAQRSFVRSDTGRKIVDSLAAIEDDAVLKSVVNLLSSLGKSSRA
ncbi:MAG: XRE family transcriptional regulator [Rhodobacteraceae bacterium]|nr:MAG: XRE family transcriptional regulator [Paracoccaceae bacterium]